MGEDLMDLITIAYLFLSIYTLIAYISALYLYTLKFHNVYYNSINLNYLCLFIKQAILFFCY